LGYRYPKDVLPNRKHNAGAEHDAKKPRSIGKSSVLLANTSLYMYRSAELTTMFFVEEQSITQGKMTFTIKV